MGERYAQIRISVSDWKDQAPENGAVDASFVEGSAETASR